MNDNLDPDDDDPINILQGDLTTNMLACFVVITIIVLFWINPKVIKKDQEINPPGNMTFEIIWPAEFSTDVDLWVQGPEGDPIGYSNRGNRYINLLRDDLGFSNDDSKINYEITVCRGTKAGEYTANVHLYQNMLPELAPLPIAVQMVVTLIKENQPPKRIGKFKVELKYVGDEMTMVRFRLDENGNLVADSVNSIYKSLRPTIEQNEGDWHGEPSQPSDEPSSEGDNQ